MRKTNGSEKPVVLEAGIDGVYSAVGGTSPLSDSAFRQQTVNERFDRDHGKEWGTDFMKTPKGDNFDEFVRNFEERSRKSAAQFEEEMRHAEAEFNKPFDPIYTQPERKRPLLKTVANTMITVSVVVIAAAVVAHYYKD